MRKLIATFVLAAITLLPAAAEHARFLGVELNGSQEQFKQQLLQVNGVACLEDRCDNTAFVYSGSYAGVDNCTFYVFHQNGTVCAVNVMFPEYDSWQQLKNLYARIRDDYRFDATLRRALDEHSFTPPYAEGDGDELLAIEAGNCNFKAVFKSDVMSIHVLIDKRKCVRINILDNQNFSNQEPLQLNDANAYTSQGNDPAGEYLQFMGLNITGRPSDFAQRLVNERGLTLHSYTSDGNILLTGSYQGIDDCTFAVLVKDGNISSVGVNLPIQSTWDELRSRYTAFKTALRNDFDVLRCTESFQAPFAEGDGDEYQAVVANKCTYRTIFSSDFGLISLAIHKQGRVSILFKVN